jgi:4'-phosphopantetheinyl transferase
VLQTYLFWATTEVLSDPDLSLRELLDPAERGRLADFSHAGAAQVYLLSHALCRLALSCLRPHLGPAAWRYQRGPWGKPQVEGESHLSFSLSHSRGLAACAVQSGPEPLGLDVEDGGRTPLSPFLQAQCFTVAERQRIEAAPKPQRAALQLWCAKEAYLKGLGCGLHEPMPQVELRLEASMGTILQPSARFDAPPGDWAVQVGELTEAFVFALARRGANRTVPLQPRACSSRWFRQQIASGNELN